MTTMRAITVRQPWAWAIVHGGKRVENRGRREPWHTAVGEVLAIHAGKAKADSWDLVDVHNILVGEGVDLLWDDEQDNRGCVIGTARLVELHHSNRCRCQCSPWAQAGEWHLVLDEVTPLAVPVPARGALGLWTVPDGVLVP